MDPFVGLDAMLFTRRNGLRGWMNRLRSRRGSIHRNRCLAMRSNGRGRAKGSG